MCMGAVIKAWAERAELPVAEVGGGDQDSAPAGHGVGEIFEAVVADPAMNVFAIQARETGDAVDHAAEGVKDTVGDLRAR